MKSCAAVFLSAAAEEEFFVPEERSDFFPAAGRYAEKKFEGL